MFGFPGRSGGRSPSAALLRALEADGLPPERVRALGLGVVEARGSYAGRAVTHIRVFDPVRAVESGLDVQTYGDLDAHGTLVLRTGHVERDGTVVLTWRAPAPDAATPLRARADRAGPGDGERIVFTGARLRRPRAMMGHPIDAPGEPVGGPPERPLAPAFAWALAGGGAILAVAVLLYALGVAVAAWWDGAPDLALGRLASAPLYREFAGIFLAGFVGIFVAREFHARTGGTPGEGARS
jgi:hypothetical protein